MIKSISGKSRVGINTKLAKSIGSVRSQKKAEELARQICLIQNTATPILKSPAIAIFAGDHGFIKEEMKLPQESAWKAVSALINGTAPLSLFAKKKGIRLKVIDAGVDYWFQAHPLLIDAKIRRGTKNFLKGPAMNLQECRMAMEMAATIVDDIHNEGSNLLGFSETSVGNSLSASLIMNQITRIPLEECTAGIPSEMYPSSMKLLQDAIAVNGVDEDDPLKVLAAFGGYEIAMMAGGMLRAAELRMVIAVDGFAASSALLVASSLYPEILDYCVFTHLSQEKGHMALLEYLGGSPVLTSHIFSSDGAGAALAIGILQTVVDLIPKTRF